jgi:hypothetical protein
MFDELSLNLLDIGMNSLVAGPTVLRITVLEDVRRDWFIIRVHDNGRGMDETHRRKSIGLGLALLRQTSEMCGGAFHIHSTPGKGTGVTASMRFSHIDRPPLGDLNATILALCVAGPDVDIQLHYCSNGEAFQFSSQEGKHNEPRRTQKTQRQSTAPSGVA